jgi:hypothetical protein
MSSVKTVFRYSISSLKKWMETLLLNSGSDKSCDQQFSRNLPGLTHRVFFITDSDHHCSASSIIVELSSIGQDVELTTKGIHCDDTHILKIS